MTLAIVLLILRIAVAIVLLIFVGVLFLVIWQDYRGAANEIEAARRVYGHLIGMREVDGSYVPTGEVYPLLPLTSLGRAPTNTIRLQDQFASSDHAVVTLRSGVWWLEDRKSRNGTGLNGMTIHQPVIVTDGDVVNIGTMHFQIELDT